MVFNARLIINWIRRPGFVIMAMSYLSLFFMEAENYPPLPRDTYILEGFLSPQLPRSCSMAAAGFCCGEKEGEDILPGHHS